MKETSPQKETTVERLKRDMIRIQQLASPDYKIIDHYCNYRWTAELVGPVGSAYEGHKLGVHLWFPIHYPLCGPKLTMLQDIFHPNIHPETKFFYVHDIAGDTWSPTYGVHEILIYALETLANPTKYTLNIQAALEFKDKESYRQIVKMKMEMHGDQTVPE